MTATTGANIGFVIIFFVGSFIIGVTIIILWIALLVKVWRACTDIKEIRYLLENAKKSDYTPKTTQGPNI